MPVRDMGDVKTNKGYEGKKYEEKRCPTMKNEDSYDKKTYSNSGIKRIERSYHLSYFIAQFMA